MEPDKIKRIADFLEKLAVAGVALGIYQGSNGDSGYPHICHEPLPDPQALLTT